jgi:hypothetical protein
MNIEEKVRLLVNKYSLTKTDRETKTLYFGSNRAISSEKVCHFTWFGKVQDLEI